ncbi:CpaF family protein [Cupriavidus pinatubonensis]|uniref:Type IV secretion system protein VirB11 n=1 Tax=Cupriavidus pinatubonensis TaxID=248026 RepID=A0ABM8WET1_9BURK|nr:ATPase, T2SS/T4P/T4SS family [Cupriavidus pinatubonensis]CAG9165760.1 Type IV secretion system protein VirB11 [Cupriavidus pinatubonensis]
MSETTARSPLQFDQLEASAVAMFFEALGPIKSYVEAPDIAEVMINHADSVWIERHGELQQLDIRLDPAMIEGAIRALAASVQKSAVRGTDQGIINAGYQGMRIAAVMQPTAIDGNALSIRRHREKNLSLADYVEMGAFSSRVARSTANDKPIFNGAVENDALKDALTELVRQRKNILVAGGTSSGKTTLLNALVAEIPHSERVLSIEDTMELKMSVPNKVRLLSNTDTRVTTQQLVALSLRFRPDRILVGEVRSGEAYDLLQALNTGHDGGMASLHANNARSALSRLEGMAMLGIPAGSRWELNDMRKLIAECFQYVLHMRRTGEMRHLSEILEIQGFDQNDYVVKRVF